LRLAARADRMKNGIPLPAPLAASLNALAAELGFAPL
jgi:LDH2 family malate/lactate/ureidoglycolate dehydrogenase